MLGTILALRRAQIDELRLARQQAEPAIAHIRSLTIFIVFIVIRIMLSFFASLFGMDTHEWGGGDNIPLRTTRLIALPASKSLVSNALFVAMGYVRTNVLWVIEQETSAQRDPGQAVVEDADNLA